MGPGGAKVPGGQLTTACAGVGAVTVAIRSVEASAVPSSSEWRVADRNRGWRMGGAA
jgi:hypothetical protein